MQTVKYAEELNYWQTSRSPAESWTDKTVKLIKGFGGKVELEAFGADGNGHSAFVIAFSIGEDKFKITWPVLKSKSGNERAARIQAATMMYHDVKARCLTMAVFGHRTAFLPFY